MNYKHFKDGDNEFSLNDILNNILKGLSNEDFKKLK